MNANASAFVWPRTGWLFVRGRAPPAAAHGRARATGVGGSRALVAPSRPAPVVRAALRRALPSATATTYRDECRVPRRPLAPAPLADDLTAPPRVCTPHCIPELFSDRHAA